MFYLKQVQNITYYKYRILTISHATIFQEEMRRKMLHLIYKQQLNSPSSVRLMKEKYNFFSLLFRNPRMAAAASFRAEIMHPGLDYFDDDQLVENKALHLLLCIEENTQGKVSLQHLKEKERNKLCFKNDSMQRKETSVRLI